MNAKAVLLGLGLLVALTQPGSEPRAQATSLPAPAAQAARDFLFAFSRNDRNTIEAMLPKKPANLFGPCPFARTPELLKPRADTRTGAVDFRGPMSDDGLPAKGTFIMRRVEEDGARGWRVRQMFWYNDLPPEADIPDKSPTEADRKQEPELKQAASEFIRAWLAEDYRTINQLTFHWWEVDRDPPKWAKLKRVDLTGKPTTLNGLRVDFKAHVVLIKVIPKQVRGSLWLVEEGGEWKVRPLTMSFVF